jgi:hypothetical protein
MDITKQIFDGILGIFKIPENELLPLPSQRIIPKEFQQLFLHAGIPEHTHAAVMEEIECLPQHIQEEILKKSTSDFFQENDFWDWLDIKVNDEIEKFIITLKQAKHQLLQKESIGTRFDELLNPKTIPFSLEYVQFVLNAMTTHPLFLLFPDSETCSFFENLGFSKEEVSQFKSIEDILAEVESIHSTKHIFICRFFLIRHYTTFVNQKFVKILFNRFPFYIELKGKIYDMEYFIKFIENKEKKIEYNSKKNRKPFDSALQEFWTKVFEMNKDVVHEFGYSNIFTFLKNINTSRHDNNLLPIYHRGMIKRKYKSKNQLYRTLYPLYHLLLPNRFAFKNEIEYKLHSSFMKANDDYFSFDEYVVRKIQNFFYKKP